MFELVMELKRRGANVCNFPDMFSTTFEMPNGEVFWSPSILIGVRDNEGACDMICWDNAKRNRAERLLKEHDRVVTMQEDAE